MSIPGPASVRPGGTGSTSFAVIAMPVSVFTTLSVSETAPAGESALAVHSPRKDCAAAGPANTGPMSAVTRTNPDAAVIRISPPPLNDAPASLYEWTPAVVPSVTLWNEDFPLGAVFQVWETLSRLVHRSSWVIAVPPHSSLFRWLVAVPARCGEAGSEERAGQDRDAVVVASDGEPDGGQQHEPTAATCPPAAGAATDHPECQAAEQAREGERTAGAVVVDRVRIDLAG